MSSDIAISINELSKCYQIYDKPADRLRQAVRPRLQDLVGMQPRQYYREFWALKDVSFEVRQGETVGIIGRNGSGKSTLLQIICGTLNATGGSIQTVGRIAALLELGSGFNPEFTGSENVFMNSAVLGLSREETEARFDDIAAFADIGQLIDQPTKTYSSGMLVRLAFAVAIHVSPDILIVDEALSVGDAYFQAKCTNRIRKIISNGATVLFVSHDTAAVKSLCSKSLLLESGRKVFFGDVNAAVEKYYSSLVSSIANSSDMERPQEIFKPPLIMTPAPPDLGSDNFRMRAAFQRIQNGLAEFVNVMLLDEVGQEVDSVGFGGKVVLRQIVRVLGAVSQLGIGYHIRDKNGFDIIYSDSGIEGGHLVPTTIGGVYVIDWEFRVLLREGDYVVASMLSEPLDLQAGDVAVVDFVPISMNFSVTRNGHLPIYSAAYWSNKLSIWELKI